MAITMGEHARKLTDRLEKGIVKSYLMYAPYLDLLNVVDTGGKMSIEWLVENTLPSVGYRSANEAFAESTGTTERRSTSLSMLGGLIDIDRVFIEDPTRVDEAAAQMNMKVRALAYQLGDSIVNGSVATDPEAFDGLLQLVTEMNNRNSRQVINASGLNLTDGANREANADQFLYLVDQAITRIESYCGAPPDFALCSEQMKLYWSDLVRRSGHFQITKDTFDRRVDSYRGCRIYQAGWTSVSSSGGTEVITDTWDGDGYTSILFVKTGDEYTHFLQSGPIRKTHIGTTENGVWDRWLVEHHVGLRAKDNGSIVRLRGLDITA